MGIGLLIIGAMIEIVFGIYCIRTKSNQKKVRSWIRISAFITFILLTLTPFIQWGFRWYLLAGVLFIWAILGGVTLIRKKEDNNRYKLRRIVSKGVLMWLIIAITLIPVHIFPQFQLPKETGEYKVTTVVYTYTDNTRIEEFSDSNENRKVTVEFWYPENINGTYPLVVFSHGAFGIKSSNMSTFRNLASNGYVVCSIDHPYHSLYTKATDGKMTLVNRAFLQEVIDVNNGIYDDETGYRLAQKWLKLRKDDINFVLETIIKSIKENESDKVYQIIDIDKIGLIGHSLGGAASAKLGRDRKDIDAVINLDADLLGEEIGFVDGEPVINHEIYPVPFLSIYTDTMKKLMDRFTDLDIVIPQKLISATSPDAFEVYITGTNHLSVTDLPLVSPFLTSMLNGSIKKASNEHEADEYQVIETMNRIVLEFFDSYLKNEGSFHSEGTY